MEAQSLAQQTLQMQLSPLDEGFVRKAIVINRMLRGEWEDTLELDYEAEVVRVTQELYGDHGFLARGFGALALRKECDQPAALGYGYVYEDFNSVWIGGLAVVPDEVGKGVLPAIAQVMLHASASRGFNKLVADPNNVLPPLLEGALDDANNYATDERRPGAPELPVQPRIADVQLAIIQSHPHLAEYDVKKA